MPYRYQYDLKKTYFEQCEVQSNPTFSFNREIYAKMDRLPCSFFKYRLCVFLALFFSGFFPFPFLKKLKLPSLGFLCLSPRYIYLL